MTLCEVSALEEHPAMDLRAIVEDRLRALGLTRAALAARMAPRWGCQPESAGKALRRWINREQGGDMTSDRLAELLEELGLDVVPRKPGRQEA